ncbi:MAG: RNA polymerase sigma factor [Oscillospiraceae bacterium]|nr:RNA polymerase sigma factor [Oscillospiraceae bacterium]MBQ7054667.1 RNA polymerase sigma factor [Oscillospiraceae bacterium]
MTKEMIYSEMVTYLTENREKFYRFAYSYAKGKEASLDIVQNAICKALEHYGDIRDVARINSWFYRVLLNEVYSYLKKHSREYATADEEMPEGIYHEAAYDKDDEVYRMVEKLPENLKTVIILRFYEDLPLSDIARITDVNLSTVKTRLYTALKKLKKAYEEAGENA